MQNTIESTKVTKRRLSWAELYRIRPDLRPANDNVDVKSSAHKPYIREVHRTSN